MADTTQNSDTVSLAAEVGRWLAENNLKLVTVESCTGGGIAHAITSVPGSSDWFDRGLVTYTNQSKHDLAGVPLKLIQEYGAVSIEVAEAMAEGGLNNSQGDVCVAVTGVAGPDGGSEEKPVGTVCFAWSKKSSQGAVIIDSHRLIFSGDREQVRKKSVVNALQTILNLDLK